MRVTGGDECPRCGGHNTEQSFGRLWCENCGQVTWTYDDGGDSDAEQQATGGSEGVRE